MIYLGELTQLLRVGHLHGRLGHPIPRVCHFAGARDADVNVKLRERRGGNGRDVARRGHRESLVLFRCDRVLKPSPRTFKERGARA